MTYANTFIDPAVLDDFLETWATPPLQAVPRLDLRDSWSNKTVQPIILTYREDAEVLQNSGLLGVATLPDTPIYQEAFRIAKNIKLRSLLEVLLTRLSAHEVHQLIEPVYPEISFKVLQIFQELFWDVSVAAYSDMVAVVKKHPHTHPRLLQDAIDGVPIETLLWGLGFGFSEADSDSKILAMYDALIASGMRSAHTGKAGDAAKAVVAAVQLHDILQTTTGVEELKRKLGHATIVQTEPVIKKLPAGGKA